MPQLPIDTGPARATAETGPPGPPFAANAEIHRRTGQVREAERLARDGLRQQPDSVSGRVALGLALLDQGRTDEARREFEHVVDGLSAAAGPARPAAQSMPPQASVLGGDALRDEELDEAFARAEADPDQMLDATTVARRALREADLDEPEALSSNPDSPFATSTMATLLEQQGDREGAEAIRAALSPNARSATGGRARRISTLERWLENLRRDRA